MNLRKIREIAKTKGVKVGNMKKENIIKSIQRTEGNLDCFGTARSGECSQSGRLSVENGLYRIILSL